MGPLSVLMPFFLSLPQAWPDHGVPNDPGCVLNFLHDVNAMQVRKKKNKDTFEVGTLEVILAGFLRCYDKDEPKQL